MDKASEKTPNLSARISDDTRRVLNEIRNTYALWLDHPISLGHVLHILIRIRMTPEPADLPSDNSDRTVLTARLPEESRELLAEMQLSLERDVGRKVPLGHVIECLITQSPPETTDLELRHTERTMMSRPGDPRPPGPGGRREQLK
ncbi:hypothetical protein BWO91_17725 [Plantibacter flavus]|uniref:hypothetical protein n=1 Tax=Plantibacter flavus TaxID=150123 RepID=UPI00099DE999|nr:hypothetical protein [Plantibacter flavus]AQX81560.1 hypothetical protein BWO91_17725 [Plantibacter flavus]